MPGEIVRLPFDWPVPGWQEAVVATYRAEAATVGRQRLEGEYADGVDFATQECVDVCSLI